MFLLTYVPLSFSGSRSTPTPHLVPTVSCFPRSGLGFISEHDVGMNPALQGDVTALRCHLLPLHVEIRAVYRQSDPGWSDQVPLALRPEFPCLYCSVLG